MELVLTAIAAPPQADITGQSQVLAGTGGSFGRAADNSWVLPDPERVVSSHHATISCQGSNYVLIDHSTNGTFVNGGDQPLGQGNSVALQHGDTVDIGPFRFQVSLRQSAPQRPDLGGGSFLDDLAPASSTPAPTSAPASAMTPAAPLDDLDRWLEPGAAAPPPAWSSAPPLGSTAEPGWEQQGASTDPLALLGQRDGGDEGWLAPATPTPTPTSTPGPAQQDDAWWQEGSRPDHAPADQHVVRIPEPPAADAIDIDDLLGLPPEPAPAAPSPIPPPPAPPAQDITARPAMPPAQAAPAAAPAGTAPAGAGLERLAQGLGLERVAQDALPQLADAVAAVVHETAERLIDILRARSSIKNELRLERTMIGASENNPLKFSARIEDALSYMFEDRGGAFLQGEAAIRDSFDDLADHQVAVLAGMRAAYEAMLAEFDPERLEQQSDAGGLLANRKARLWEAYQQRYARLRQDRESAYARLFGETFARVYEEQIAELKAARQLRGRGDSY